MKLNLEKLHWSLKIIPILLMAPALIWIRVVGYLCAMVGLGTVEES
jgi:hypothetical protein